MKYINLIIGGSSGIGREIVKLQSQSKEILIATFNKNPSNLPEVNNMITFKLDLFSEDNIVSFVKFIGNMKGKIKRIFLR